MTFTSQRILCNVSTHTVPEWVWTVTFQCPAVGHPPCITTKNRLFLLCLLPTPSSLCPGPFACVSSSPALALSLYL